MGGIFLVDTNAVIARLNGDLAIEPILQQAQEIFIPSIVLGELYFGAEKSVNVTANVTRVEQFASGRSILVVDADTAREYGTIRNKLRLKGRPLPENDVWIAALALQHNLTLLTRDEHFKEVDGLSVAGW